MNPDLDSLLADVKAKLDAFNSAKVAAKNAADAAAAAVAASAAASQASDHAHVDLSSSIAAFESALDALK